MEVASDRITLDAPPILRAANIQVRSDHYPPYVTLASAKPHPEMAMLWESGPLPLSVTQRGIEAFVND